MGGHSLPLKKCMSKISSVLVSLFTDCPRFLEIFASKFLSDKIFLKIWFRNRMGYWMNFENPRTFNEKLQWLKINDRKPIYTTMVDKYAVKKYVADIIGQEYIIPNLGVWDHFDDIEFNKLPNQFVLKCTHDSGGLVICKDKSNLDFVNARSKIEDSLGTDFYRLGREWPYKNVPHRIIAETYMEDTDSDCTDSGIKDYKFFCFNGVVRCFKIDFDRFGKAGHKANYYTVDGSLMDLGEKKCPPDYSKVQIIPDKINEMIALAEKLSVGHRFLRVDFYYVNQKIYFGELTFFPASGVGHFLSRCQDEMLGSWLKI